METKISNEIRLTQLVMIMLLSHSRSWYKTIEKSFPSLVYTALGLLYSETPQYKRQKQIETIDICGIVLVCF